MQDTVTKYIPRVFCPTLSQGTRTMQWETVINYFNFTSHAPAMIIRIDIFSYFRVNEMCEANTADFVVVFIKHKL